MAGQIVIENSIVDIDWFEPKLLHSYTKDERTPTDAPKAII